MSTSKPSLKNISKYKEFPEIQNAMAHIFADAQTTLSGHRKLIKLLRRVQIRAIELDFEESFNFQITKLISRILEFKKSSPSADRIAKFCSVFVATLVKEETDDPTPRKNTSFSEEDDETLESISAEFVDYLIRFLLRGIESKFKDVRYRVVQLLAYLVNYITEIDEQLFTALRYSLNRRLHDKESIVRIQAVVAVSRFQYLDEARNGKKNSASSALMKALENDESPEVRRAALLNLVKSELTIPSLLKRGRDVNSINRRLVYSRISKEIPSFLDIDVGLREDLLRWGLNDRDESVKSAAVAMLTKSWLPQSHDDILELLENLQVVESESASLVMDIVFEQKNEGIHAIEIPYSFWKELTVEKAFFARTYFDFCLKHNLHDAIEKNVPELTKLSYLASEYFKLRETMLKSDEKLVDEYKEHITKLEKFNRLIQTGTGELRELKRKIEKDYAYLSQLKSHSEESSSKYREKVDKMSSLKSKRDLDSVSAKEKAQKITELSLEVKDLKFEIEKAASSIEAYEGSISELTDKLKVAERAQTHRVKEREKYIETNTDLEERYSPFGDQLRDLEFVIEQLLSVISGCDYADIAGTRRLMPIITNAMRGSNLTSVIISLCVKILRKASIDERYFSQLCTEIITDIRDSSLDENEETFVSAVSLFNSDEESKEGEGYVSDSKQSDSEESSNGVAKKRKVAPSQPPDNLLIQCLTILQHYLEIAEDTSSNSYQLDTLIDTLIRPALTNTSSGQIRFLGYKTLGLFTLIDKGLGASNLKFFGISASKAHDEDLKILCMKIIFDILSMHGVSVLNMDGEDAVDSLSLARLFYSLLKSYHMPKLQAVVAEGLCKLFLADLLVGFGDDDNEEGREVSQETMLLEILVLSYFNPANAGNQELKQTLAFCIPVYCFSHESHQVKLSNVSGDCFYRLFRTGGEFSDSKNLSSPTNVLQQLIYWCDPNSVANITPEGAKKSMSHFWQAMKLLQIVEQDSPKNVKKAISVNLNKLSLSEELGSQVLSGLKNAIEDTKHLISNSQDKPEFTLDAAAERALEKFNTHVAELLKKAMEKEEQEEDELSFVSARVAANPLPKATSEAPIKMEDTNGSVPPEVPEEVPEEASGEDPEVEAAAQKAANQEVTSDLAAIDKMLDEEDEVDYNIDIDMD